MKVYDITETQLKSLELALESLRKIKIDKLTQKDPKMIETACGNTFIATGCIYTVISQIREENS